MLKRFRKKSKRVKRNFLILFIIIITISFLVGALFNFKSTQINKISSLGFTQEKASQLYKACKKKTECFAQQEALLNTEINNLEEVILSEYGLAKENYASEYQAKNHSSKLAYKSGLEKYIEQLKQEREIALEQEKVAQQEEIANQQEQKNSEIQCEIKIVNNIIIASKKYCLPSSYAPGEDNTAKENLNAMINAASNEGVYITVSSGYRSYEEQVYTYNYWVGLYGQEYADTISAKPGNSEHQTGLAFDLNDGGSCNLEVCFENTTAGIWLKDNAHKYGFIIRYPQNKENITGYSYEPWHFRYVGEIASQIYNQQITLEEFLNI